MHAYEIFREPEHGAKAVKRGFSWPAFFFSAAWAFSRRLWGAGATLSLLLLPLLALAIETKGESPAFKLGRILLLMLVAGFKGNSWRRRELERSGFEYLGAIRARDAQDALAKVVAAGGVIPAELKALGRPAGLISMPRSCQGIFAMIELTWKAAFRYRLFWVLTCLLLGAVTGLPLLLKDDGTAEGFTQILLTYTLGSVTAILGICTLWLACGTLARDIEECQMQMVAVKPIARWQIWLGKWLGLLTLNAALLAISGLCIYGLLEWRARRLPAPEQARLNAEVLVARGSAREDLSEMIETNTTRIFDQRVKETGLKGVSPQVARDQIREQLKSTLQLVPPDGERVIPWVIHLGAAKDSLRDQPLFLRFKFLTADGSDMGTFDGQWAVGLPTAKFKYMSEPMNLAPSSFHEIPIPPNLFDEGGDLVIVFHNASSSALLFQLDDGLEVLYRQGGFGLNYLRALGIILCWTTLLATLGLASASFLSFPVAAFFSLALLVTALSSSTLANVVEEGTIMGYDSANGRMGHTAADLALVPMFRGMLEVIRLAKDFSPIGALGTGRVITWAELGRAVAQILLLLGGVMALGGIFVFNRRELATAQGNN